MSTSAGVPDPDCTPKCRSRTHAALINSAITKGTVPEIKTFCRYLCHNFWLARDAMGRTALHLASSVEKDEFVEWLIEQCHAEVDIRDQESGWTSLHRAVFYGQLGAARILLRNGASLSLTDFDGLTPIDIAVKDRPQYISYNNSYPREVYVWGSNENFNLGLANQQSPKYPELLEAFRKDDISITNVLMCKFHSVFLSSKGKVYTCGHGHGGRLGQNSEQTSLNAAPIPAIKNATCIDVAAGQDHMIFLMEDGQVMTCGLNLYHQLGHQPPPDRVLYPKPIVLKFLKGRTATGVCAGRYHSVIYTKDAVFTFGLNAGQLGHQKGDRTQISPRQISALNNPGIKLQHVVSSNGAIVCATEQGDIYVMHEYLCRKISSKFLRIKKLCVTGGNLDSRCDVSKLREGGGEELKIAVLTDYGKVFLWQSSNTTLTRCLFACTGQPFIEDLVLNRQGVVYVTERGEGFMGTVKDSHRKTHESSGPQKANALADNRLIEFVDREECYSISMKRIPHLFRATSVVSDFKGRSYAALQCHPKVGLIDLPSVEPSEVQKNFCDLLNAGNSDNMLHDIRVKVKNSVYTLHRYILASRSDYFQSAISNTPRNETITLDHVSKHGFEEVLNFIYSNTCDVLIKAGYNSEGVSLPNSNNKKIVSSDIKDIQEASRKLGIHVLAKRLDKAKIIGNSVKLPHVSQLPKLKFDRERFSNLHDITLVSDDNVPFDCHRCILAARLDYFNSMLSCYWIEGSASTLKMPVSSDVLKVILDYIYADEVPKLSASEDIDFLCRVLVATDQFLITRLKQICEVTLGELVTLRNVAELLELSYVYGADQLKALCCNYICVNIPAVLEYGILDCLSNDVVKDLARSYRNFVPSMSRRIITPYPSMPSKDNMEKIHVDFGDRLDGELILPSKSSEVKGRSRRRHASRKISESSLPSLNNSFSEDVVLDCKPSEFIEVVEELSKALNSTALDSSENKLGRGDIELSASPVQKDFTEWKKVNEKRSRKENTELCSSPTQKGFAGWKKPSTNYSPKLEDIMQEESKSDANTGYTFGSVEIKKSSRLSQKQRKQMTHVKASDSLSLCSVSPTSPNSCPWYREEQNQRQTFPGSFWDLKVSTSTSPFGSPPDTNMSHFPSIGSHTNTNLGGVPNLYEILKAEEEKVQSLHKLKPKPLHIINLEDQAIEELLSFYHAENNYEERITVKRILPENYATPVWKK